MIGRGTCEREGEVFQFCGPDGSWDGGNNLIGPLCVLQAPAQSHPQLLRLSLRRGKSPPVLGQETGIPQPGGKKAGGGQLGAGVGDPHLLPGPPRNTTLHLLAQVPVPDSWVHEYRPKGKMVDT